MVYGRYTLWLFNIAMGNCPFIDGLPINSMGGFSMANCECHNQRDFTERRHVGISPKNLELNHRNLFFFQQQTYPLVNVYITMENHHF